MNRWLTWFNLLGVLALTVLCVAQWRANRAWNLALVQQERRGHEQAAQLEAQTRANAGQATDLASLRVHLSRLADERQEAATQCATAERRLAQALAEIEQLRTALTNWTAAITVRDERLQQAAAQVRAALEARNHAVTQFNQLAVRHNQLVSDFDHLQGRLAAALTNATRGARSP